MYLECVVADSEKMFSIDKRDQRIRRKGCNRRGKSNFQLMGQMHQFVKPRIQKVGANRGKGHNARHDRKGSGESRRGV